MQMSACKLINRAVDWIIIPKKFNILDLSTNLTCGQSFRFVSGQYTVDITCIMGKLLKKLISIPGSDVFWWRTFCDGSLIGVFAHRVWQVKQSSIDRVAYRVLACPHWKINSVNPAKTTLTVTDKKRKKLNCSDDEQPAHMKRKCSCQDIESTLIQEYLQQDVDMKALFKKWKKSDKKIEEKLKTCPGIRVLKQDPTETLFSFLCSVNNSISRIVPMIEKMATAYGSQLLELGQHTFNDFPAAQVLATTATDEQLRKLGFGYRARYIVECAQQVIANGGEEWLNSLRHVDYETAVEQLIKLPGVGRKVADCICLMSLDKSEAVPIDTHVRQIAVRDYGYIMKSKSLTNQAYKDLSQFFRSLWGSHAGWAQAVLFVADIKPLPKLYAIE